MEIQVKRFQPLLKLNDYILVDGNKRKVIYLADNGVFKWHGGWANINQLEANEKRNSTIIFKLNTI